ncbi:MAG: Glycine cleavage system H protein [Alphaproteobacteria bacterium MarineAlpha5_Bin8]|nr:MAG: Glycine cleavage system H protein [Alphaproteobacteria bacterium MarineAlpha5_Bin8]PPR45205.1 MAG: Glycine cleavage system H protein [Alphaproteobacteria bacterium MarineAlpha5_Bin7]PPR53048.1 MAG: Glycine cleavage system H protein [Alphaproteobacteria bacterium MarineAlpha5_Bin6]|tara:strand:+ start:729 stop:1100 length:372 start_codon:yes stop_codon:yes gene_type:complete
MNKKYTKEHEWVEVVNDIATVGITNHAQESLGDIVFVELPEIGKSVKSGNEISVIESVKAASDIYSPIDGEIIEINNDLTKDASVINQDAENEGWIFKLKISDSSQINSLMSLEEYNDFLKNE